MPVHGSAPLGDVLPALPNVRELPRLWRDRLHREVSPHVTAYWHDSLGEWHIVEREPGHRRQEEGRLQLHDYKRLADIEGVWPHPFKIRQALYAADGWTLLHSVDRFELADTDLIFVRWLRTVPGVFLREAEALLRDLASTSSNADAELTHRQIIEYNQATAGDIYRKAFRGQVMQKPLRRVG